MFLNTEQLLFSSKLERISVFVGSKRGLKENEVTLGWIIFMISRDY